MSMATDRSRYLCPLCKTPLSRERYESVLHIDEERRKELRKQEDDLQAQRRDLESELRRAKERTALLAKEADAKAKAKYFPEIERLKQALAEKPKVTPKEKKRIEDAATQKVEAHYGSRLRKAEADRDREAQRRRREGDSYRRLLEQAQHRADTTGRPHLGPEGEEELVAVLRRQFPTDDIEHRGRGGDVIQTVLESGSPRGKLVYECKRTSQWQSAFVRQLKRAMELHGTRYGLLVSRALPRGQTGLCIVDGVVVTSPDLAHHIAGILREAIVALSKAELSEERKREKTDEIYRYLRSDDFRTSVQSIEDRVQELRTSLEREKSNHEGWWRTREQHYGAIARQTSAVGARVQEILGSAPVKRLAVVGG